MLIVETVVVALAGAGLGAATGWLLDGTTLIVLGAAVAGFNGMFSGARRVYDWTSPTGWVAFLLDSSWGLLGSTLALVVHLVNVVWPRSGLRGDHSRRRNRHVYERGFRLKAGYAFAQGNAISNVCGGEGRIEDRPNRVRFIGEHEELHLWQSRLFGPLMQATYVLWALGGLVYGFVFWLWHRDQKLGSIIQTTVYFDNPFEFWAYRNNHSWPPPGSHPSVRWPCGAN